MADEVFTLALGAETLVNFGILVFGLFFDFYCLFHIDLFEITLYNIL